MNINERTPNFPPTKAFKGPWPHAYDPHPEYRFQVVWRFYATYSEVTLGWFLNQTGADLAASGAKALLAHLREGEHTSIHILVWDFEQGTFVKEYEAN